MYSIRSGRKVKRFTDMRVNESKKMLLKFNWARKKGYWQEMWNIEHATH